MASLPDLRRITLLTVLAMATLCSVARSQDEPMGFSDFPPDSDFGGGAGAPPGEFSLFGCFEVSKQEFSGLSLNSFYEDPTFVRRVHNTADLYSSPKTCNKLIAYIRANLPADAPKPMDDEYGCYLLNSAAYVCGNYSSSADIYKLGKVISPPGDDANGFPIAKSFSRGLIDIVYPVVGRCGAFFNIYLSVDGYNTIADPESTAFEYVLANDVFDKCPTPKTGFPYCDCYRGEFNGRLSADKYNKRAPAPFGVKLGYYTKPYDARTNAHCFTLANPKEDGYGYPYEDFPDFTDKDPSPGTCGGSGEGFKYFNKLAKYEINLKYNLRHKIRGVLDASGKILPVSWAKDSKTGKWVDVVKVTNLSPSVTQQLINPGQTTMCLLVEKDTTMATLSADPNGIFFAFFDPTLKCCSRTYAYLLTPQGSTRRFKNMN